MAKFMDRLAHAWNAFNHYSTRSNEPSSSYRQDKVRLRYYSERSIISSIINRIAIDCAAIDIKHVRVDENGNFIEIINSELNKCLSVSANIDQTGRALIQDLVVSMCDDGCVALVPVETTLNPYVTGSYDITNLRVAKIVEWRPTSVVVALYNERTGKRENVSFPKSVAAIMENPLYSVMNEPNSTLQRLTRKLALLDAVDEQSSSGKLDVIIQLPYVIKSRKRREEAENRRKEIEMQLTGSKYGIAYTDGTERVIQLNRPVENNLMGQIEYLTKLLYSQIGVTEEVFNGTADEKTLLNYYNRCIEPFLSTICLEMKRKYLTKTAISQNQSIEFFRDPFKLVPVQSIADIADKFTRNEILSSNELRAIIGYKPIDDPRADELRNKNLNPPGEEYLEEPSEEYPEEFSEGPIGEEYPEEFSDDSANEEDQNSPLDLPISQFSDKESGSKENKDSPLNLPISKFRKKS